MLKYEIISSSSREGNCVLIDDVMVDIGVSFKKVAEAMYDVKYLLITHVNQDHLNIGTLKKIYKLFPNIKILSNYEVYTLLRDEGMSIDIINTTRAYHTSRYDFKAFSCYHTALTYGYVWQSLEGKNIIYVTDTSSLDNAPKDIPYDYLFLESNYDEKKLEESFNEAMKEGGYDRSRENIRHLSTRKARGFYYMYRRNQDSEFIELHKSTQFY